MQNSHRSVTSPKAAWGSFSWKALEIVWRVRRLACFIGGGVESGEGGSKKP